MINACYISGNLVKDCEVKDLPTGPLITFTVAVNEKRGDQEYTEYIPVSWFTKFLRAQEFLKKGAGVILQGKVQTKTYEKNGQKATHTGVVAFKVQWLNGKHQESEMPF